MWLTHERVFYAGLLGAAAERSLGGHGVYVSPTGQPMRIRIGGGAWQSGELLVVPPQVPHQVVSDAPLILNLLIESESVDPARLPHFLQRCGAVEAPRFVQRVRAAHAQLLAASGREQLRRPRLRHALLRRARSRRAPLDARIRQVVDAHQRRPGAAGLGRGVRGLGAAVVLALPASVQAGDRRSLSRLPRLEAGAQPAAPRAPVRHADRHRARHRLSRLDPLQPLDPPGLRPASQRHPRRLAAARVPTRRAPAARFQSKRGLDCKSSSSCSQASRRAASTA